MRAHFLHHNVRDTVIIREEGNFLHPQCPRCNILVPWKAINGRNVTSAQFAKGAERKIWRLVEEDMQESVERDFQAYSRPLETAVSFKYLRRVLTLAD